MKIRVISVLILLTLAIPFFSGIQITPLKAESKTLYVGGSGPGNYSTIQSAINSANDGDQVFVYAGIYVENIIVNKMVNLYGEKRDTTIIDGNNVGDVIKIIYDNVIIKGFTIRNSGHDYDPDDILNLDSGFDIQSNNIMILDNIILNNSIGISSKGSTSKKGLSIYDNIFLKNAKDGRKTHNAIDSYACYLMYTDSSKIINNEFYDNDNGIKFSHSDFNEIIGNRIVNTTNFGTINDAMCFKQSDFNIISDNYIQNTSIGINIYSLADLAEGNSIYNNTIKNVFCAVHMQYCTKNIVNNNLFFKNKYSVYLNYSFNNFFHHNDFIHNTERAYDDMTNNWSNNAVDEGNFWDDYFGEDADNDGIGDSPYNISGGFNQDMFPLMKPLHNIQPDTPQIDGPSRGRVGKKQDFFICSIDLNDDYVYYTVDWGNNQTEEFSPYLSGERFMVSHVWETEGTYLIMVRSKDIYNAESELATLEVSMPRIQSHNPIIQKILRISKCFPLHPFTFLFYI